MASVALSAQTKDSVLIITDAEGVAGSCRQEQTEPTNAELQKLLAGEINAAVAGLAGWYGVEARGWVSAHEAAHDVGMETLEAGLKLDDCGVGTRRVRPARLFRQIEITAKLGIGLR